MRQPRSVIAGALIIIATLLLSGCDNAPFSSDRTSFRAAQVVVDDPRYLDGSQWYLDHVRARQAWQLVADHEVRVGALTSTTVAVIDSPIDHEHEDLRDVMMTPGPQFLSNASDEERLPDTHGTHVAGLVGAQGNNGVGIAGVGFNGFQTFTVTIRGVAGLPGKNGLGSVSDIADAIFYAAGYSNSSGVKLEHPVSVINMSLGTGGFETQADEDLLQDVIRLADRKGVVMIAAAGNANHLASTGRPEVNFPARFPEVIAVGSLTSEQKLSWFSYYGPDLELMAPGGGGATKAVDGPLLLSTIPGNGYGLLAGTSMAAPLVAGIAAMVRSVNPALSAAQVRAILQETATDLGDPGRDDQFGYGLVNAEAAVQMAIRIGTGSDTLLRGRVADLSPGALPDTALRSPAPWDATGSRSIAILLDPDLTESRSSGAVAAQIRELTGMEVTGAGPLLRGTVPVELDGDEVLRALYELELVRSAVQDRLLRWR